MSVRGKRTTMLIGGLLAGGILTGCLDDGSDDSGSYSSGGSQSSASGSCSSYKDLVSSSERAEANSCGTQVSAYYAQADSTLSAAIASCQSGDSSAANQYYDNYKEIVSLGRDVKSELCGGSTGSGNSGSSFEDPSSATYYNLCTESEADGGRIYYRTVCYGPVKSSSSTCGPNKDGYSYLTRYSSMSSCKSAAQSWLDSQVN